VTLLALALIAAGGIFLIRSLRITSPRVDRFVAVVGLLFAGLSFLVVGAQAAAKLLLDPCWF
jgi:hypothetical protein